MKSIYFIYAVLQCCSVGIYSENETFYANVIGTLQLISSRTLNIEEKVNGYGNLKHELNDANENLNGYEELKHQLDTVNEKLDVLVESVNKLEGVFDCGRPELLNGNYEGKSTFYRHVLHPICDEGYTLSGNVKITCLTDGQWTRLPTCKPDCESPHVLNSLEYDNNATYPYGFTIEINCKYGYRRHGDRYLRCDGEYGWRGGDAQCHLVDCGQPALDRCGTYGDDYTTTLNSTLSLTCNEGYLRFGPDFIRCQYNGRWDGRQTCLERTCIEYNTENGTNATECLLKKSDSRYYAYNVKTMGAVSLLNPRACMQYCLENHNSFSHVFLYWDQCKCIKRVSKHSLVEDEANYHLYFREADLSTYVNTY